jgi:hypothetical protein
MADYLKSASEMATRAGVTVQAVYKWQKHPNFPAEVKGKGVKVADFDQFRLVALQAALKSAASGSPDLKRKKLELQIEELEIQVRMQRRKDEIDQIEYEAKRGLWASREEVMELCQLFAWALDQSVQAVGAITRDADAMDAVRQALAGIRLKAAAWMKARDVGQSQPLEGAGKQP